jgi:hypothetical protein
MTMTLHSGDIILIEKPPGVGMGLKFPVSLRVEIKLE